MLHHRTEDPAVRAKTIAKREAKKVWRSTGDLEAYKKVFDETYEKVLAEFNSR